MASLQEALQCLSPTTWDSIPTDPAKLRDYINDISSKARLIVDSVPETAPSHKQTRYAFESSSLAASRITPSPARTGSTDPKIASLQREWGKPIKITSSKENPLEIPVYKVQGGDGKGHWFGRRSVHEGLPFSRWKSKLASEMDETLEANQARVRKGRVADQAVRGIGAERLIERVTVKDEDGERVLGTVNVYHVSAQFPKPTTPRDFVTLIINWETEVNGGSEAAGAGAEARRRGRNWMMVSKPCEHPDAPPRQGYIRGQYESVEFIREIPVDKPSVQDVPHGTAVSPARSEDNLLRQGASADPAGQKGAVDDKVGRTRGKMESAVLEKRDEETAKHNDDLDRNDEEDPWPVEWIMVTRSDPGGNIPRWMVEKGTPKSICTDAIKFIDWACRDTTTPDKDERDGHGRESSEKTMERSSVDGDAQVSTDSDYTEYEEEEHHGLIASFAYLLNAGLERYAPRAVLDYLPHHTRESSAQYSSSEDTDGPSDKDPPSNVGAANSNGGTEGLEKDATTNAADAASQTSLPVATNSVPTTPLSELAHENISPVEVIKMNKKGKLSSHEKQLAKLAQRKREVEAQLETIRNEIQTLQLGSSPEVDTKKARAAAVGDSGVSDQASSSIASTDLQQGAVEGAPSSNNSHHKHKTNIETAHLHKVASGLFQQESKLLKQLGKIEKNQLKEASKIEAQQRKNADREEKSRSRADTDALRREVDTLKKEVERLRSERQKWLDLIASLQAENTRLAARQGGGEGQ
ncbi:uncharacterized protein CDV56_107187 [Aspergillus thermomutatus]|uniref:DUF3074 domain-containing protein n=1 Tax=Aspergillus thermomutatus TaxID=41047 RepID=A0A397H9K1_ASPTH|nr:uncharacterized protein CDV56_107187 [Aspergillus thermomutatus]RHZ59732.1 hypothetical protein CDV56_107187 [Aspergillus thermomutatus]